MSDFTRPLGKETEEPGRDIGNAFSRLAANHRR